MTSRNPLPTPSRRGFLAGLGALAAAPVVVATLPAASAAAADPTPVEYECLADLIEAGEVSRADLVAR